MEGNTPLEEFNKLTKEEIDETYKLLKIYCKKVSRRESLEEMIKNIVRIVTILKNHIGLPILDINKNMAKIPVRELREIHRGMRDAMKSARTRKEKLQKLARMIQVVDYFLQY